MKKRIFSVRKLFNSTIVPLILGTLTLAMAQAKADIVINEVDSDQTSTDSAEFIELYDGGVGSSDLSGLSLVLYNGSDDASYQAFDLDGFTTNADGYFVLCANSATTVNCDLDVSPNTNLIQNGADAVALVIGDAVNYPNDTPISTDNLIDALVYDTNDGDDAGLLVLLNPGQPQVNEDGSGNKDMESNQRCANGSGGFRNSDTYEQHTPTPGAENSCGSGGEIGEFGLCAEPATFIHEVQGSGLSSTIAGTNVVIEGVVFASFQGADQLNGFYMQEEAVDQDADIGTSEGIFISDSSNLVNVGDVVRVQGNVNEYFDHTELSNINQLAICSTGSVLTSTSLTLPVTSMEEFEQVEGMLVSLSQPLTVNENYNLSRYGELMLSDGRTYQFTHSNLPDPTGYIAHLAELPRNQIILDDANSNQNPEPVIYPAPGLSAANTLRAGSITSITGALGYSFGSYRIYPTEAVSFSADNPRTTSPENVGGNFKVASINVLNYFTTIDDNGDICGPSADMGCRGADSAAEFTRQRDKIINAISTINADIVGLVEIENNDSAAISDLVNGLNTVMGAGTYTFVDTGTIGTDAIKVGFIYKPSTVMPQGTHAILDSSVDSSFIDNKNRPSLAQTFKTANDEVFTLAVNHFKSKGSDCDEIGDPNLNDGQGNCAATRANAATALLNWLGTDPTASGDSDVMIIGDLNAYAMENAITNITSNGYTNLVDAFVGATAYSYVFSAEAGYLDHALASPSLTTKVSDVTEWHINADEPNALDYNTEYKTGDQQTGFYANDAYRMSDHDPIIIGLDFTPAIDSDGDGVNDADDNCVNHANPNQLDGDNDGDGNRCDADFNNDGVLDSADAMLMRTMMRQKHPAADLNEDGRFNGTDIMVFRELWFAR